MAANLAGRDQTASAALKWNSISATQKRPRAHSRVPQYIEAPDPRDRAFEVLSGTVTALKSRQRLGPWPRQSLPTEPRLRRMAFDQGRVTFVRFKVAGEAPAAAEPALLEHLQEHAFKETPIGAPDEVEVGFTTGVHLLDTEFTYDKCVFGNCVHFAMRVDAHKVPSEWKKAYRKLHEQALAAGNPSGMATREQKLEAREEADRLIHQDLAAGRFRRSKLVSLLWDTASQTVYCAALGEALHEHLRLLFRQAFRVDLHAISAGASAGFVLDKAGRTRDFEDLMPSPLTAAPPEVEEGQSRPEVPWVVRAVNLKDFVGNEFLLWLWHALSTTDGSFQIDDRTTLQIAVDQVMDQQCAWDARGKMGLRAHGPLRLPEAGEALKHGKWPRKVGMILADGSNGYELTLQGETLAVSAAKLPDPDETEHPREVIEQRLQQIAELSGYLDGLFGLFLKERTGDQWKSTVKTIREWADHGAAIKRSRRDTSMAPTAPIRSDAGEAAAEGKPEVVVKSDAVEDALERGSSDAEVKAERITEMSPSHADDGAMS